MESDSDDCGKQHDEASSMEEQSWNKIRSERLKEGYREGYSKGQDEALQEGFNIGYKKAAHLSFHIASMRGILCCVTGQELQKKEEERKTPRKTVESIQELINKLSTLEQKLAKAKTSLPWDGKFKNTVENNEHVSSIPEENIIEKLLLEYIAEKDSLSKDFSQLLTDINMVHLCDCIK